MNEADREARIEQLLLWGLDHYFAGKYEQAINIWTRVTFLERGHGRARAYIERARGALAERQRESDELLHTGVEAYHAGDLESARTLLNRAVDEGGVNETALVFLQRLGRLELATDVAATDAAARDAMPGPAAHPSSRRREWAKTAAVSVLVALGLAVGAMPIASWLAELPVAAPAAAPEPVEPLPIVRRGELQLARARTLYADGRLREALRILEQIDIADPLRAESDRLRADVQRELLATIPSPRDSGVPR